MIPNHLIELPAALWWLIKADLFCLRTKLCEFVPCHFVVLATEFGLAGVFVFICDDRRIMLALVLSHFNFLFLRFCCDIFFHCLHFLSPLPFFCAST